MPISSQEWLCKLLKIFGYTGTENRGRCFGIASMAMQAFLSKKIDTFNERIHHLNQLAQLSEEQIKTLIQDKRMDAVIAGYDLTIGEVYAFFDGVELYQNPGKHKNIFKTKKIPTQFNLFALPIVIPVALDKDPPVLRQIFCGTYHHQQLTDYIILLQTYFTVRTSIMLHSINHTININFDPEEAMWCLFDANDLSEKKFSISQPHALSQAIMDAFNLGHSNVGHVIFSTNCFVCTSDVEQFDKNYIALHAQEKWQLIHQVTPETIKKDACNGRLLLIAAQCGDHATIKNLLAIGDNPQCVDQKKRSALHFAAQNGKIEIIQTLLKAGANPNCGDQEDWTPLHIATIYGQTDIVRLLLSDGINANPNVITQDGWTPLHIAAYQGNVEIIRIFLEIGACQKYPNDKGQTPIQLLFKHNQHLDTLIAVSGINVKNKTSPFGRLTQLHDFFEKLKTLQAQINQLEPGHQNSVKNFYTELYQLGKEWVEKNIKNTFLFEERIQDISDTYDVMKKNPHHFFGHHAHLEAYQKFLDELYQTNELLKTILVSPENKLTL